MNHSITSIFALSTQCNAAVFALRTTFFDTAGRCSHTTLLPFSVAQQVAVGRHISDTGILDLTTLPMAWEGCATDESELMSPRLALKALSSQLQQNGTMYITECEFAAPILHSLYQQFIPENEHAFLRRIQDLSTLLEFASRDSDHQNLSAELLALFEHPIAHAVQA